MATKDEFSGHFNLRNVMPNAHVRIDKLKGPANIGSRTVFPLFMFTFSLRSSVYIDESGTIQGGDGPQATNANLVIADDPKSASFFIDKLNKGEMIPEVEVLFTVPTRAQEIQTATELLFTKCRAESVKPKRLFDINRGTLASMHNFNTKMHENFSRVTVVSLCFAEVTAKFNVTQTTGEQSGMAMASYNFETGVADKK